MTDVQNKWCNVTLQNNRKESNEGGRRRFSEEDITELRPEEEQELTRQTGVLVRKQGVRGRCLLALAMGQVCRGRRGQISHDHSTDVYH